MNYQQKYLKYKNKYLELKKMSGGFICDHYGTYGYGYNPLVTEYNNHYNICVYCRNWACFHNGTNLYNGYNHQYIIGNSSCTLCGQTQQNIVYQINNNIGYIPYVVEVSQQSTPLLDIIKYVSQGSIIAPVAVPVAAPVAAPVAVPVAVPVAAPVAVPVAVAVAVPSVRPPLAGSGPFTKVNNFCVFDASGIISLQPPATANIAYDKSNRPLIDYRNKYNDIFGNSINVEAYLYPFNHPSSGIDPTKINTSYALPIQLQRITISDYNKNVVRNLLTQIQAIPPNTFLLCIAYTNSIKYVANPPGQNNEEFIDVQLCISGKVKKNRENYKDAATREIIEECGLVANPANLVDIGTQQNVRQANVQQYLLNALPNTLRTHTRRVLLNNGRDDSQRRVSVMIYGDLAYLQSLITDQLIRTDVNDVQGLVLVRLT
jgi:hypothetical protein